MTSCPDLDQVMAPEHATHVAQCEACQVIVELARERVDALACARFEDLLSVRGGLATAVAEELDAHLATCVACRAIANTMAPIDAARSNALPTVATNLYSFGREVARGGMGRVVAAHDLRIGRPVAVKELLGSSPSTAARFEREARITARLQHPGIVPIYEIGAWPDGTPFYAMRMVEGRTLSAALADADNRLALLPSVIAAAEAVAFAHAHDVIHRDLKPSNIMVGAFGETVVIDWGLAKELDEDDSALVPELLPYRSLPNSSALTSAGEVMGTAAYMPPEQASGDAVDQRADVYALGAILYHLLAGVAPYAGTTSVEIVEKVKSESPPPLPANAPRDLASIVAKAMARAPADRYGSARELADELERFQTGRVVEAHAYSRGELMRRWLRRRRGLVIGGLAALVALVIAGTVAVAGILRERDNANAHEAKEHAISVSLLEEQGRQELIAGHNSRALAYLDAAMQQGVDTSSLRFMLARALPSIEGGREQYACDGHARMLVVSDDGTHMVAACGDVVRVWDLATQRVTFSATVHGATGASMSRDGLQVIAVGERVVLLDAVGGVRKELGRDAVAAWFAPDGTRAIVTYADAIARVWDLASGTVIQTLGTSAPVGAATRGAVSADGRIVALASDAGHVALFDLGSGRAIAEYEHGSQLGNMVISDDGNTLATCGTDARAIVWRADAAMKTIAAHNDPLITCALSRDGAHLFLSSQDSHNDLWDARSGRMIASFSEYVVRHAAFSRDGSMFVTSGDLVVRLWDASSAALLASYDQLTMTRPGPVAFARDGSRAFAADGSLITAWTTKTPRRLPFMAPDGELTMDTALDGARALTRGRSGHLTLWDVTTGTRIGPSDLRSDLPPDDLLGLFFTWAISADGHRLVARTMHESAVVIDTRDGATLATIPTRGVIWPLLDDIGGRVLMLDDDAPRVWDIDRNVEVARFPKGTNVYGLSPDGSRVLLWVTAPTSVEVWDLRSNRSIATLHPSGDYTVLGFDATGTRVVLGEQPGVFAGQICVLYDVETGRRIREHSADSMSFDPERRHLVVADATRGRAEIWNTADGEVIRTFPTSNTSIAAPSSDLDFILTTNYPKFQIVSTVDGRALAEFDTSLDSTTIVTGGWTVTSTQTPRWIAGTHSVISRIGHSSVWDLPLETRSADQIHGVVSARVPWREIDGKLVPRHGRIEGVARRAPATLVIAKLLPKNTPYEARTSEDGVFVLDDIPLGSYVVSANGASVTANVTSFGTVHVEIGAP